MVFAAELGIRNAVVLCVDHGLRAGAARERAVAATLAANLSFPFHVLTVPAPPGRALQGWAREARYRALSGAARDLGLAAVATGHTADDVAETLLMRLGRGASVRGLSAMPDRTTLHGVTVIRPFLAVRRPELRNALLARGIAWCEDPSNADPRFGRSRVRALLPELEAAGLSVAHLAASANNIARANAAIDRMAGTVAAAARRIDRAGAVRLSIRSLREAAEEVRLRVLGDAVRIAGGRAPRLDALRRLSGFVERGAGRMTLGRAVADADVGSDAIMLWREARHIAPLPLHPGEDGVFDDRFIIQNADDRPFVIAAIGPHEDCPTVAHPPAIAQAPGVFIDGVLVAAPTLGVMRRTGRPPDVVRRPLHTEAASGGFAPLRRS